jgi:hypothetical protein
VLAERSLDELTYELPDLRRHGGPTPYKQPRNSGLSCQGKDFVEKMHLGKLRVFLPLRADVRLRKFGYEMFCGPTKLLTNGLGGLGTEVFCETGAYLGDTGLCFFAH